MATGLSFAELYKFFKRGSVVDFTDSIIFQDDLFEECVTRGSFEFYMWVLEKVPRHIAAEKFAILNARALFSHVTFTESQRKVKLLINPPDFDRLCCTTPLVKEAKIEDIIKYTEWLIMIGRAGSLKPVVLLSFLNRLLEGQNVILIKRLLICVMIRQDDIDDKIALILNSTTSKLLIGICVDVGLFSSDYSLHQIVIHATEELKISILGATPSSECQRLITFCKLLSNIAHGEHATSFAMSSWFDIVIQDYSMTILALLTDYTKISFLKGEMIIFIRKLVSKIMRESLNFAVLGELTRMIFRTNLSEETFRFDKELSIRFGKESLQYVFYIEACNLLLIEIAYRSHQTRLGLLSDIIHAGNIIKMAASYIDIHILRCYSEKAVACTRFIETVLHPLIKEIKDRINKNKGEISKLRNAGDHYLSKLPFHEVTDDGGEKMSLMRTLLTEGSDFIGALTLNKLLMCLFVNNFTEMRERLLDYAKTHFSVSVLAMVTVLSNNSSIFEIPSELPFGEAVFRIAGYLIIGSQVYKPSQRNIGELEMFNPLVVTVPVTATCAKCEMLLDGDIFYIDSRTSHGKYYCSKTCCPVDSEEYISTTECAVCMTGGSETIMRILSCMHTCCVACIISVAGDDDDDEIKCPVCRQTTAFEKDVPGRYFWAEEVTNIFLDEWELSPEETRRSAMNLREKISLLSLTASYDSDED